MHWLVLRSDPCCLDLFKLTFKLFVCVLTVGKVYLFTFADTFCFEFFYHQQILQNFIYLSRSIALWNVHKKKPLCTVRHAHRMEKLALASDWECTEAWVTSVAALRNSDVVASGKV